MSWNLPLPIGTTPANVKANVKDVVGLWLAPLGLSLCLGRFVYVLGVSQLDAVSLVKEVVKLPGMSLHSGN